MLCQWVGYLSGGRGCVPLVSGPQAQVCGLRYSLLVVTPRASSLGAAQGGGWVCVSMGSIVAPLVGLVVLLRVLLLVLGLLDGFFSGGSRPRVIPQGVTASLIDVELWGEAEGG